MNINHWCHLSRNVQGTPQNASSSIRCNCLHHFFCYSTALNLIFTACILHSPTFPNCLTSLQQMKPTPSQVRKHHSQKNHEVHLERAITFKKAANLHWNRIFAFQFSAFVHHIADGSWPGDHQRSRMTIPIRGSMMTKVRTPESPTYHWTSKKAIYITSKRSNILARRTETSHCELQGFHCKDTEPCRHCHCTSSSSTFPKTTSVNSTIPDSTPKVSPPWQIIQVWPWTIRPGAAATKVQ